MTTAAQERANKQNAWHSTGPRTEQGKQRSSQNALKHGFRAKDPIIPGEDPDEFYRHRADLEAELRPVTALEENLVEQIIDITWRLKRFARIAPGHQRTLRRRSEQPRNQDKDADQLLGKSLAHNNALSRFEAQLARRYHNIMKELRELRKQRRGSVFFSGLASGPRAQPQAESNTAAGSESEAAEPTQTIASRLESIAPMNTPDREPDPSRLGEAEFYRTHPQSPHRTGNLEAAA